MNNEKDMIALLSFPRSGNHLVRFIIEYLTERATLGCKGNRKKDPEICKKINSNFLQNVDINNPIIEKWHRSWVIPNDSHKGLIMILRHPIEACISHNKKYIFNKELMTNKIIDTKKWFLKNLNYYQSYNGYKEIIIYENLVFSNYQKEIRKIVSFLNISNDKKLEDFLRNFKKYKKEAFTVLPRKAKSNNSQYYRNKVEKIKLNKIESILSEVLNHSLISNIYY
ncbi:MAG: hypothetical protein ACOCP8_08270 [archaeon]